MSFSSSLISKIRLAARANGVSSCSPPAPRSLARFLLLAFDPHDDTLWLSVQATSTLEHYSTAGVLLGTFSVLVTHIPGVYTPELSGIYGGEFGEAAHDNIPPTTTAIPSSAPNPNGWNNSNVTITLTATDNPGGSGVKQIEFALGGAQNTGWQTVAGNTASITISRNLLKNP